MRSAEIPARDNMYDGGDHLKHERLATEDVWGQHMRCVLRNGAVTLPSRDRPIASPIHATIQASFTEAVDITLAHLFGHGYCARQHPFPCSQAASRTGADQLSVVHHPHPKSKDTEHPDTSKNRPDDRSHVGTLPWRCLRAGQTASTFLFLSADRLIRTTASGERRTCACAVRSIENGRRQRGIVSFHNRDWNWTVPTV